MTGATDFYIPPSWRFRQATLLLAAHLVAVSLIRAPVSMAQSACNTSGSGENQPQQQCPQSNSSETQSESSDGNFLQRLTSFYKADWTGKLPSTRDSRAADAGCSVGLAAVSQLGLGIRRFIADRCAGWEHVSFDDSAG